MSARQLAFELNAARPSAGALVEGEANEAARSMLDDVASWPRFGLILEGPPRSGKSTLATAWARGSAGLVMGADQLTAARLEMAQVAPACALEGEGGFPDEEAALHLLNLFAERGAPLLLVVKDATIASSRVTLPDLRSRLAAMGRARIAPPDDAMIAALLSRAFARRGVGADPAAVAYLVKRTERSYAAVETLAATADQIALERGRRVTAAIAALAIEAAQAERHDSAKGVA